MSLKFTVELCVKTMKNDAKIEEELTWQFTWAWEILRILTRALKNLKNLLLNGLLLTKVYNVSAKKSIEELCLMALIIDVKFEGKMTCAFKNDMRDLTNFHQSMFESLKIGTLMVTFYPKPSRKFMSLKFTGEFCVMTIEEESTCQLKIDIRNLTNFDASTRNVKKLHFNTLLLSILSNSFHASYFVFKVTSLCFLFVAILNSIHKQFSLMY